MSPINKKKLDLLRLKLDKLDNELLLMIKKRSGLVKNVLKLKVYKNECSKKILQDVFDYIFKQLELNIREIGYGDVSVNKNMKNYINLFYKILETAEKWEKLNKNDQQNVFLKYLNLGMNNEKITNYFENYLNYLKNNTFNSLLKGVIKLNF